VALAAPDSQIQMNPLDNIMRYTLPQHLPDALFRAYDIRGDAALMTPDITYALGRAIASEIRVINECCAVVGRDGRLSSPALIPHLQAGLLAGGVDVIDLGVIPSPLMYFGTCTQETQCGVMLTASHNPKHHNGLKIILQGKALTFDRLTLLKQRILNQDLSTGQGHYSTRDITQSYIEAIVQRTHLKRPYRVVLDCGHAAGSIIAPQVFEALGCEVIPLFCTIDGNFPIHHPDPSRAENLKHLKAAVLEHKADVGFAFDGDADRLGVICNEGHTIWPDQQMMLFAQAVLKQHPNAPIIFDIKCSQHLEHVIEAAGGQPILWKTGHSLIKAKMRECNAPLAGEMSGHIFFDTPWYGFDDGIYAGTRFLQYMDDYAASAAMLRETLPYSASTPELKIPATESQKITAMQALAENLPEGATANTLDGLRLHFKDGWWLIRPSNTTAYLTVRLEANSDAALNALKQHFTHWVQQTCPELDLSVI